jgi:thiol-disulfide isomerase/thioredoxin
MERSKEDFFPDDTVITELKPSDFDSVATWKLKAAKRGCCIILWYASWCPHCQSVREEYSKYARKALFMNVYAFNCEKYKDHLDKIKHDMPGLVQGYPTLVFYKNGEPAEHYEDQRDVASFVKASMRVCQPK